MIRGLLNRGNMPGTFPSGPDLISKSLCVKDGYFFNILIFMNIFISPQPEPMPKCFWGKALICDCFSLSSKEIGGEVGLKGYQRKAGPLKL